MCACASMRRAAGATAAYHAARCVAQAAKTRGVRLDGPLEPVALLHGRSEQARVGKLDVVARCACMATCDIRTQLACVVAVADAVAAIMQTVVARCRGGAAYHLTSSSSRRCSR